MVDQCVKGEGLVQINAQVRTETQRINIVDVLKPTDEALAQLSAERNNINDDDSNKQSTGADEILSESAGTSKDSANDNEPTSSVDSIADESNIDNDLDLDETLMPQNVSQPPSKLEHQQSPIVNNSKPVDEPSTKWIIDTNFKKDLARLRISEDPKEWTIAQVRHWLQWAVRQFNLTQIKLQDWSISGKELTNLTIEGDFINPMIIRKLFHSFFVVVEFQQKVPNDPEDLFWTHFELLRKCRMVAIRGQPSDDEEVDEYTQALTKKTPRTIVTKQVKQSKPISNDFVCVIIVVVC